MPIAISGLGCWRDWYRDDITAHDGLIAAGHERLRKLFERPMSATSLKLLLRDPLRFVWGYALGWKAPEEADEPLSFNSLQVGNLVHASLRSAVDQLEAAGGLGHHDFERPKISVKRDGYASKIEQSLVRRGQGVACADGRVWSLTISRCSSLQALGDQCAGSGA